MPHYPYPCSYATCILMPSVCVDGKGQQWQHISHTRLSRYPQIGKVSPCPAVNCRVKSTIAQARQTMRTSAQTRVRRSTPQSSPSRVDNNRAYHPPPSYLIDGRNGRVRSMTPRQEAAPPPHGVVSPPSQSIARSLLPILQGSASLTPTPTNGIPVRPLTSALLKGWRHPLRLTS